MRRTYCVSIVVAVTAVLAFSSFTFAQAAAQSAAAKPNNAGAFDPHDLSGVWQKQRGFSIVMDNPPPMTPEGKAKFDTAKPVYGPRAVVGIFGNDPVMTCDPLGMPRNLFAEVSVNKMQFAPPLADRMFQFFEWGHVYRDIWMDGRALPKDPDPAWMGYSVGRWEGDTFIVDTVGLDERTWVDHFGNPVSDAMRIEERYKRVDRNTLEMVITITDPKMYTKPWVGNKRVFQLVPNATKWESGLPLSQQFTEGFCAPSVEAEFNRTIRDPAGGK